MQKITPFKKKKEKRNICVLQKLGKIFPISKLSELEKGVMS